MYAFRNLFDKHPLQISAVVVAGLNYAIVADWIEMTADEISALNAFLILLLGLFIAAKTANVAVLNELRNDPPTAEGVELTPVETPIVDTASGGGLAPPIDRGSAGVELLVGVGIIGLALVLLILGWRTASLVVAVAAVVWAAAMWVERTGRP